jgi:phosphomannomutase
VSDVDLRAVATAWRDDDPDPATRAEVDALLAAGDDAGLAARFGARLQFGTAGLRGELGAGPNRMNRALVRRATAGLAAWLRSAGHDGPVVVGRDARHGSADFAADTCEVLAAAGFSVRRMPRPLPTPMLAYAVRHLGCVAGVMVTASHNPPKDNGYKVYVGDGAQIIPPVDAEISAAIDAVGPVSGIALAGDGITDVGEDVIDAYLAGVQALSVAPARDVRVVYTAMHGVGYELAARAFADAGFPPIIPVVEQVEPDPDFPTVAFPNPEEPGALDLSLTTAAREGGDLVIANDPDADRLGVALPAPDRSGWRALNGNEIGVLLADHLVRHQAVGAGDLVATTIVSSRMLAAMAEAAGVSYAETLTGFKWVARAGDADGKRFVFGYEEALGYCIGSLVRDKDGISAAVLFAELVATLRADGQTVWARLDALAAAHGAHRTRQVSQRVTGAAEVMAGLRAELPGAIGGHAVVAVEDLVGGGRLPPSDVLIFGLDGGARVVIRPSGTEPKLKCYLEAPSDDVLDALTAGVQALLGGSHTT